MCTGNKTKTRSSKSIFLQCMLSSRLNWNLSKGISFMFSALLEGQAEKSHKREKLREGKHNRKDESGETWSVTSFQSVEREISRLVIHAAISSPPNRSEKLPEP